MTNNSALVTRLLDTAQLRVPNIPDWLRDDLALAAETIIELRRQLDAKPRPPTPEFVGRDRFIPKDKP